MMTNNLYTVNHHFVTYSFIEVAFLGESVCVADFNPYCSRVIEKKMICAGY